MKRNIPFILNAVLLLVLLGSIDLQGQGCCSSGAPLLGSMELGTSEAGIWQLAISYRFNTLNDLFLGDRGVRGNYRQRRTHSIAAEINYGLGQGFTANTLLTFVQQERTIRPAYVGGTKDFVRVGGVSDIILLLKYTLFQPNLVHQREISLGAGIKLPTGANDLARNNIVVSYDLQPGTGATDEILWGYFFQGFRPTGFLVSGIFSYRLTGTNDQHYRFGRELISSLGGSYRIADFFIFSTQFRYRHTSPDQFLQRNIPNTGGQWIYLIPGTNVPLNRRITLRAALQFPLYRNLRGIQLTTSYALTVSAFYMSNSTNN